MKEVNRFAKKDLTIESLIIKVSDEFNGILRANLYELGLDDVQLDRLRLRKRELRQALKNCGIGDSYSKNYIITAIQGILTDRFHIDTESIDEILNINNNQLDIRDKFDIVLYSYKQQYGTDAFVKLIEEYKILNMRMYEDELMYFMSKEDVSKIYNKNRYFLSFMDKLTILAQRIYADYRGLGIIDELRDMKLDGISGGVSGKEGSYKNVWVFIKGITLYMSFLDFRSEEELERICMNIYRYNHPGQLSKSKGFIINEMKDNSRIVVVRPPFSESFAFFLRKFSSVEKKELSQLITDEAADIPINILKWIVKGCQITAVTGAQGSGKTTLLMALIEYIPAFYTIRVQESAFELHLRDIYSNRNIISFRETDYISGQEGLDLQKKTDGTVNILGEVATAPVSAWVIQMSMVASIFTMFTHHAKTTKALVTHMRNSLLTCGQFSNEDIALEQVIQTIRIDVHMNKDVYGNRYIERITEIIPDDELHITREGYTLNNILEYRDGTYIRCNSFSKATYNEILSNLTNEEKEEFMYGENIQFTK